MIKGFWAVLITCLGVLILFAGIVWIGGAINANLQLDETAQLRFVFVGIGLALVLGLYFFTPNDPAWELNLRQSSLMLLGAVLYAVFSWLFGGAVFTVPSVSQVSLRPAIIIPIFFGYAFGPLTGLATGAVGNMLGDALSGFILSPQWGIGNGLIGVIAGMPLLIHQRRRPGNLALVISTILSGAATVIFLQNRSLPNLLFYDPDAGIFGDATISLFAGLSSVIGLVLVLVVRFAYAGNSRVVSAITWGMLGNFLGLGFAALSDIWINGFSTAVAVVGEFLPAAGPNLIFAAILLPIFVSAFAAMRPSSTPGEETQPR